MGRNYERTDKVQVHIPMPPQGEVLNYLKGVHVRFMERVRPYKRVEVLLPSGFTAIPDDEFTHGFIKDDTGKAMVVFHCGEGNIISPMIQMAAGYQVAYYMRPQASNHSSYTQPTQAMGATTATDTHARYYGSNADLESHPTEYRSQYQMYMRSRFGIGSTDHRNGSPRAVNGSGEKRSFYDDRGLMPRTVVRPVSQQSLQESAD